MSRALWLDPGFGASGDMLLGTLLGLGAPLEAVRADVAGLGVTGWSIDVEPVLRAGIAATRAIVVTDDHGQQDHDRHQAGKRHGHGADHDHDHGPNDHAGHGAGHGEHAGHGAGHGDHAGHGAGHGEHGRAEHRAWSAIDRLLAGAALPERVRAGSRATFELLGRVEAGIHGVTIDEVHFHEVGALDAIVDIVGAWSALHHLAIDQVASGPVGIGTGVIQAAHGRLPAPAPATVELLAGAAAIRPVDWASETVTPTGAALLRTMVTRWGPVPAGRLVAFSRGAGGRNPATHPNVLGALLVETDDAPAPTGPAPSNAHGLSARPRTEAAMVLATNLDDVTAELLGHLVNRLLDAGADDAWVVPIGMKKNRPGHELRVLCRPDRADGLETLIFAETGTLGLRRELVAKQVLERSWRTVTVRGHEIRVKLGPHGAKAEHDDVAAVGRATGLPLRLLGAEAVAAALQADTVEHRAAGAHPHPGR